MALCLLGSALPVSAEQRGRVDNRSYSTLCAEVDNVDIPLVCPGVETYRITAVHPRYNPTAVQASGVDFTDCPEFTDEIWLIGAKDGLWNEFKSGGFTNEYMHYAPDAPPAGIDQAVSNMPVEINNDWIYDHRIHFTADQVGDFNAERKFGSTLTIRMALVSSDPWQADPTLEIRAYTWSTNGWTDQGTQTFRTNSLTGTWNIPDLTWLEGVDTNVVRLRVVRDGEGGATKTNCYAYYDYLEMKKRAHKGSNNGYAPVLYEDGNIKVDAVWEDYWVNYPEEMKIDVVGGGSITTSQYVRIWKRVPGHNYSNEVFVLYQNAYARIMPLPPTNLWGVPYGASAIIGPTTNEARPNAHIDRVIVDPQDLSIDIEYLDGSTAHLELRVDRESHIVDVSEFTYDTITNAATRFRSMWAYDGKADIDRVESERGTYPIMQGWT
ncbi:MAG: hypothetical protein JXB04_09625, partial [Kiritimatiellae bacterium]|nr:hypothetical protein [Kiritimatiellia bacterium]